MIIPLWCYCEIYSGILQLYRILTICMQTNLINDNLLLKIQYIVFVYIHHNTRGISLTQDRECEKSSWEMVCVYV